MKIKRILSGVIGLPIIVLILTLGNKYIIDILFAIVALIAIKELSNAFKENKAIKLGYVFATLLAFIHVIPNEIWKKILILLLPICIVILFIQVIFTNMKTNFKDISIAFFAIFYIVGFLCFMPLLFSMENGRILIWYILLAAWGTDTFAYLFGVKFGKHKLTKISPKKSVEGSIAGLFGAVILSLIYTVIINKYFSLNLSYVYILVVSIVLSILSQIGDISASSIKRYSNIKDFGNLIPGHGGILDRIDSIILIAPFAYCLLTIF